MSIEAMRQALEALDNAHADNWYDLNVGARAALTLAIEQAEQGKVAMTERDEFAKAALQSMMSRSWFVIQQWKSVQEMTAQYAEEAYAFADAMMSARSKEKNNVD
jgi:hypothetical protein